MELAKKGAVGDDDGFWAEGRNGWLKRGERASIGPDEEDLSAVLKISNRRE